MFGSDDDPETEIKHVSGVHTVLERAAKEKLVVIDNQKAFFEDSGGKDIWGITDGNEENEINDMNDKKTNFDDAKSKNLWKIEGERKQKRGNDNLVLKKKKNW